MIVYNVRMVGRMGVSACVTCEGTLTLHVDLIVELIVNRSYTESEGPSLRADVAHVQDSQIPTQTQS